MCLTSLLVIKIKFHCAVQFVFIICMDDFQSGPHSFTIFVDSKDIFNLSRPQESQLNIFLPKPLELSPGTWEVCLKRMILTPTLNPLHDIRENSLFVYYKHEDNFKGQTLSFDTSHLNVISPSISEYVKVFNNCLPETVQTRMKLSVDADRLKLYADNVQIKFKDFDIAQLLGFNAGTMYPPEIAPKQIVMAPFPIGVRNGYHICKVTTDFTAPLVYGSSFFPIIGLGIIPKSDIPTEIVFTSDMYVPVIKSTISKISISILDSENKLFPFTDFRYPIILQINFRCRNYNG